MRLALSLVSVFSLFPAVASAQAPADVADLVGARGAGGETQLLSRGYEARQSNVVRDQRFTFWWNARLNRCISVSTADGRYAAITSVPAENCGTGGSHAPAPAVDHDDREPEPGYRDPNSLVLVCYGAGTRPTVTSKPTYSWNPWTHKWEWSNQVGNSAQGFNSDVQIELFGNAGRIHLGSKMVPPFHSGGDNGWWDLDNLVVTRDRITASYRLNGMNKPKLTVDRRTGQISIAAQTNFSGQCDLGDWGAGTRRF
ncbi:hypothetical protein E5675_16135 [Sphingopyxis sp. PAMC25046]|uniref:hypothetical protein n=1 Tax=Sphingopyxis sp. PAMC25046 TaxID=2565556 RepID=UPI00109D87DF|nr:hypothetical protein [Sphingopyxis sp. PAMC25046]QCB55809.1 hypothetical protein E5675_16135 [Sphingopyxis sp. PAMC25046]